MARPVQLAPGSLALVLCPQGRDPGAVGARGAGPEPEPEPEPGPDETGLDELLRAGAPGWPEAEDGEPGGRALFRAFRRANARCFWNARLARAASRLAFQGWLRRGVLLVHGPPGSLQVLRDAWLRRALRAPRGFRIRAVGFFLARRGQKASMENGDVFPVQMKPIAQSQFIPLAEVLCCAIADMNAAHVVVTQETLMDQLVKHYPGIATPSQDILYTTLGNLIKERKIYHTGEGYFIVTPQTYFITNTMNREKKQAPLAESPPLPTSITYLVSMDSQADLTKENTSPSHCKSCRCFPDSCPGDGQVPPSTGEGSKKGHKNLGEAKPSVQSQAISTSEENRLCDGTKTFPSPKDKEKPKKFGLRLFWRQMSRKERPKKDHQSFSAQFPPEEWPVRDEENLDNIPRDVEHEIIKRINPELTVDNLIRHTVLMQKYEERKKYMSQGTSTDLLAAGHKQQQQPIKAGVRRRQSRSGRHRRKTHSNRERSRVRNQRGSQGSEPRSGTARLEKHSKQLPTELVARAKTPEEELAQKPLGETQTGVANPHFIYKKRISNPFLGFPHRGNPTVRGYKGQKNSDLKPKQTEKAQRFFQKPKSLESSRNFDGEAHQLCTEQPENKVKPAIPFNPSNSSSQPVGNSFRDCLSDYSHGGVLKESSKNSPVRESQTGQNAYGGHDKAVSDMQWKIHSPAGLTSETQIGAQHFSLSQASCPVDRGTPGCGLIDKALMHQFQNLRLSSSHQIRQPERQNRDPPNELTRTTFGTCWGTINHENEGFTDDDEPGLYQKEVDGEDDACSSLEEEEEEEEEEDFAEKRIFCPTRPGRIPYCFTDESLWDNLEKSKLTEGALGPWKISSSLTELNSKIQRFEPQASERNDVHEDGSQKMNFSGENHGLSPFGYRCDEETGAAKRVQVSSEHVDGSIFEYYNTSEADSEAETLQNSTGEMGEKSACWGLGPQSDEMRKHFRQKPELFRVSRMPICTQQEQNHLERTENHSLTGDSGIDSPRTQSLASNNSVILEGLKRRRSFLQNFEDINNTRKGQMLTSNSLLQLTPVINV